MGHILETAFSSIIAGNRFTRRENISKGVIFLQLISFAHLKIVKSVHKRNTRIPGKDKLYEYYEDQMEYIVLTQKL